MHLPLTNDLKRLLAIEAHGRPVLVTKFNHAFIHHRPISLPAPPHRKRLLSSSIWRRSRRPPPRPRSSTTTGSAPHSPAPAGMQELYGFNVQDCRCKRSPGTCRVGSATHAIGPLMWEEYGLVLRVWGEALPSYSVVWSTPHTCASIGDQSSAFCSHRRAPAITRTEACPAVLVCHLCEGLVLLR